MCYVSIPYRFFYPSDPHTVLAKFCGSRSYTYQPTIHQVFSISVNIERFRHWENSLHVYLEYNTNRNIQNSIQKHWLLINSRGFRAIIIIVTFSFAACDGQLSLQGFPVVCVLSSLLILCDLWLHSVNKNSCNVGKTIHTCGSRA